MNVSLIWCDFVCVFFFVLLSFDVSRRVDVVERTVCRLINVDFIMFGLFYFVVFVIIVVIMCILCNVLDVYLIVFVIDDDYLR